MNYTELLEEILNSSKVSDKDGNCVELKGSIDGSEGKYIFNLIKNNPRITLTLEIGCGYGISALFICSALKGRQNVKHIIIDPFQYSDYSGMGILNLNRVNCNFFELIPEYSEYALPTLAKAKSGAFDLIFIDGWHTFDHIMLDLFYSNKLLRIGGYIVIDDCRYPSIAKAITYLSKFPAYKFHSETDYFNLSFRAKVSYNISRAIPQFIKHNFLPFNISQSLYRLQNSSMMTFQKIANDERDWKWFKEF